MADALFLRLEVWRFVASLVLNVLPATIIGGYPMFEEALEAIRRRRMTMEFSMFIAVTATLLIGQFFTGLAITLFVLFAELLEHLTVSSGRNVIEKLVALLPRPATVRKREHEKELDIQELTVNDIVVVKPGSRVPVDGVVTEGPIARSHFALPLIQEQALVVNVSRKGLVLIGGCGHQGLNRIFERSEAVFAEPVFGLIASLHYPV